MSRIVVVDDHEPLLEVFQEALGLAGHTVIGLTGADLDELAPLHPDVLIIDIQVGAGERDGLELMRRVRQHPALRQTPVIAASADVRVQRDPRPDLKALDIRLLLKPFTIETLAERVSAALHAAGILPGPPASAAAADGSSPREP